MWRLSWVHCWQACPLQRLWRLWSVYMLSGLAALSGRVSSWLAVFTAREHIHTHTQIWCSMIYDIYVNEVATGLSLLPHREHRTRCRHSWSCCSRPPLFVANWKHFCSSLPSDTGIQTDDCFVMRPRSLSRRRNTNTAVTDTVTVHGWRKPRVCG